MRSDSSSQCTGLNPKHCVATLKHLHISVPRKEYHPCVSGRIFLHHSLAQRSLRTRSHQAPARENVRHAYCQGVYYLLACVSRERCEMTWDLTDQLSACKKLNEHTASSSFCGSGVHLAFECDSDATARRADVILETRAYQGTSITIG